MMPELHVMNLDINMQSGHFKEDMFLMVLDRYGWTMSDVLVSKKE